MGKPDDDDFVRLTNAWTMEHRRNRREAQMNDTWEAHNRPYTQAMDGSAGWLAQMAKGAWTMQDWIVENLFLPGHIGLMVGDAGTCKSLTSLDLMISMVSGTKWLGHYECLTSPVVYLAGEGKIDEHTKDILGLLLGRKTNIPEFMERCGNRIQIYAPGATNLTATAPLSSDAWWENVRALVESTHPVEARPKLWILDPLLALIDSTDKADAIRPFIARCRWLAEATQGYVQVNHHTKKGQGGALSRSEKIRGESMLRNLFDNVLYLENDAEDSRLIHVYANKLKRGPTDDTKPLFHMLRHFDEIDEATFYQTLREVGVKRTGEENPKSLKRITLRHVAYSPELHRATSAEEKDAPIEDVDAPRPAAAAPAQRASSTIDKSSWDTDCHRVWDAILTSDLPLTVGGIQQVFVASGLPAPSVSKVQARLDVLDSQGLVASVPTPPGVGRPGKAYTLKSRI
jgi:hypothetical protein